MCPFKKVHTRTPRSKWTTPEIFALIRNRKILLRRYKMSHDQTMLSEIRSIRNIINSEVDKAKETYFKNLLNNNRKDPNKFWRNIKSIIEKETDTNINIKFLNPETGDEVQEDQSCDFVNNYFATVADRICNNADSLDYVEGDAFEGIFIFLPPERYDVMLFAEQIDVNSSSCIFGVNSKICKILLLHLPEKMRMIFANLMFSGIFPADWAISTVKLLPKSGDLSHPGKWRP